MSSGVVRLPAVMVLHAGAASGVAIGDVLRAADERVAGAALLDECVRASRDLACAAAGVHVAESDARDAWRSGMAAAHAARPCDSSHFEHGLTGAYRAALAAVWVNGWVAGGRSREPVVMPWPRLR